MICSASRTDTRGRTTKSADRPVSTTIWRLALQAFTPNSMKLKGNRAYTWFVEFLWPRSLRKRLAIRPLREVEGIIHNVKVLEETQN